MTMSCQALVDNNVKGFIHPPDRVHWINFSGILLPICEGIARQIPLSLIERHKQARFAQHCYAELVVVGGVKSKIYPVLLTDSDHMRQERMRQCM